LKVNSGVPNSVQVTKDKNTPTNDNKSVNSTKSVSSIGTESAILDDYTHEATHLVNFHTEERDSNHLRQQVGGKERRKTVIGKTRKSLHCPNEVQEHNEVSYEILPEQKANLKKLPKKIEVDEKEKGNFNQMRGYAQNKLTSTHICCLDNRYAVTCSKTVTKDDIKEYMRKHKLSERDMMDNKVLSPTNVFPLEIECIEALQSNGNKKYDSNSFFRTLTGKKQWIKMPVAFKNNYIHFLKQKIEGWAYNYMDFHANSYNRKTKELHGYCYHKKQQVYNEYLKTTYVKHIEQYHRQYMLAVYKPQTCIALNIGKDNNSFKKNNESNLQIKG